MVMRKNIAQTAQNIKSTKLREMFVNCFFSTLDTTVEFMNDGSTYVITGDINAMWLRDSSMQVMHYLPFCEDDKDVKRLIKGLIKRQMMYINIDTYANAFNREPKEQCEFDSDETDFYSPWIWERKFELDSLCLPLLLACRYFSLTNDKSVFDNDYNKAVLKIIETLKKEQFHSEKSTYYHMRNDGRSPDSDSMPCNGKGNPVRYTGMIFSGYRPSDDACKYGYLVPSNMLAAVVLKQISELSNIGLLHKVISGEALQIATEIESGIKMYALKSDAKGAYYTYETDGLGNSYFMDDANMPSLLSMPYFGFCENFDPIYQNTRKRILGKENPFYFSGKYAKGVGSPHTPNDYVWHIGLCVQALTTNDETELKNIFNTLLSTDANTGYMHEGFDVNNPENYTRSWFAWANSMFAAAVYEKIIKKGLEL